MDINSIVNSIHVNLFDIILVVSFIAYVYEEGKLGLLSSLTNLFSMIGGIIVGIFVYRKISEALITNSSVSKGISDAVVFLLISVITYIVFSTIISYLVKKSEVKIRRRNSRIGGIIFGSVSFFLISSFIVSILLSFPVSAVIKTEIRNSHLGRLLSKNTQTIEILTRQIFGGAISDTLNFMTIKPDADSTIILNFKTTNLSVDPVSEKEMFNLVNAERKKNGLFKLVFDEKLSKAGRNHAKDMFSKGYFSHYTPEGNSPFERLDKANVLYAVVAENLAYAPEVELAHSGLMKSIGHRKNILDPSFNKIGIGVIDAGIYGKMFVQEFTD